MSRHARRTCERPATRAGAQPRRGVGPRPARSARPARPARPARRRRSTEHGAAAAGSERDSARRCSREHSRRAHRGCRLRLWPRRHPRGQGRRGHQDHAGPFPAGPLTAPHWEPATRPSQRGEPCAVTCGTPRSSRHAGRRGAQARPARAAHGTLCPGRAGACDPGGCGESRLHSRSAPCRWRTRVLRFPRRSLAPSRMRITLPLNQADRR